MQTSVVRKGIPRSNNGKLLLDSSIGFFEIARNMQYMIFIIWVTICLRNFNDNTLKHGTTVSIWSMSLCQNDFFSFLLLHTPFSDILKCMFWTYSGVLLANYFSLTNIRNIHRKCLTNGNGTRSRLSAYFQ